MEISSFKVFDNLKLHEGHQMNWDCVDLVERFLMSIFSKKIVGDSHDNITLTKVNNIVIYIEEI